MRNIFKFMVCSVITMMFISSSHVFAEHYKAQEYRVIFESNKYVIEYTEMDEIKNESLDIGKLMMRDGDTYMTAEREIVPNHFGFLGNLEKIISIEPIALYEDGKYYAFMSKEHALCIREDVMREKKYYYGTDWRKVVNALSAPNMFLPIMGYNKFNNDDPNISKPEYKNSSTETIKNKVYNIDEYYSDAKNVAGKILYRLKYSYYYNNDELAWVRTSFVDLNGNEKIKGQIKIFKISNELSDKMNKWRDNINVTDLGEGDINELLGDNIHKKGE